MPFGKDFLNNVKTLTPSEAIVSVIDTFQITLSETAEMTDRYKVSLDTMSLLMALCRKYKIDFSPPDVKGGTQAYVDMVWNFTINLQSEHRKNMYRSKVSTSSDKYFTALFDEHFLSDDDIAEIQELLLQLRQLVDGSPQVPEESKNCILKNITKIEQELHGCSVDLERVAGILLPLYGKAKEIKDACELVAAISAIVGAAIAKAHALNLLPGKGIAGFLH
jgi:acyl carrier protein